MRGRSRCRAAQANACAGRAKRRCAGTAGTRGDRPETIVSGLFDAPAYTAAARREPLKHACVGKASLLAASRKTLPVAAEGCPVNLQQKAAAALSKSNQLPPSKVAATSYGSATVGALRFPVVEL